MLVAVIQWAAIAGAPTPTRRRPPLVQLARESAAPDKPTYRASIHCPGVLPELAARGETEETALRGLLTAVCSATGISQPRNV